MYDIRSQDISLTDNIIGKGAFGEVRVAYWRNIAVAYKRPHLDIVEDSNLTEEALQQEIQVLSQLRHPNLVLFIGACRDAESSKLCIVTELLPTSLYDMLEVAKISLSLPDILDVAMDVISGLEYLHGHDPVIVHRDISSKNILIGGNRAKIADLGQAKIFSSSAHLSRQSKLPGAMAYAAPETLTGKYFSPIDIFSFGILLSQMCTGAYPRIDQREEQIQQAGEAYPLFKELIESCVHYQPSLRPTSRQIAQQLRSWKDNDRNYPLSRRQSPEKDVGILALHWMHRQIDEQTSTLRISLHQQTQLLQREEERWRTEASRVDQLQQELTDKTQLVTVLQAEVQSHRQALQDTQRQLRSHLDIEADLKSQLKIVSTEQEKLLQRLHVLEGQQATEAVELQQWKHKAQQYQSQNQQLESTLHTMHTKQDQITQREALVHRQLAMQVDYARDVEARLEQTLTRWREEHETRQRLDQEVLKLNRKCSEFLTREAKVRAEKDLIDERLSRYEGLPVPEEIKARFQDLEADILLLRQSIATVEGQRDEAHEQYQTALQELIQADVRQQQWREDLAAREQTIQQRDQQIAQLQAQHQLALQQLRDNHTREEQDAHEEQLRLKEEIVTWGQKCKKLEETLAKSIAVTHHYKAQLLPSMTSLDEIVDVAMNLTNLGAMLQLAQTQQQAAAEAAVAGAPASTGGSAVAAPAATGLPMTTADGGAPTTAAAAVEDSSNAAPTVILPPQEWTVDESIVPRPAMEAAAAIVAEAERRATKAQHVKPVIRLTDIAVKHLVERTLEQRGLRGLIALLHHPRHNTDERVMWRAARSIREQLVKHGDTARQICATSYGTEPVRVTGKELTAAWPETTTTNGSVTTAAAGAASSSSPGDEDMDIPLESDLPADDAPITPSEVWTVRLLQVFPECVMLQAQALRIVGTLAFQNDLYRRKVGEQQGIYHVLQVLRRHGRGAATEGNLVLYGMTALTNLCHASNDNRSRFHEFGGSSVVLDLMRFYLGEADDDGDDNVDVNGGEEGQGQAQGQGEGRDDAKASSVVTKKRGPPSTATKKAVRPLLSASTLSRLLCQCCYVLLTVVGGSEVAIAEYIVDDEEGHALILRCLTRFREDAELQQNGLWALYNLATASPRMAAAILRLGVVEYCQMIVDVYTASLALHPTVYAEVIRQAHATLQVLLKSTTTQSSSSAASSAVATEPASTSKQSSSSSKAAAAASTLILPAINIYSATQTVVTPSTHKKKATNKATAVASQTHSSATGLLSKSTSHL